MLVVATPISRLSSVNSESPLLSQNLWWLPHYSNFLLLPTPTHPPDMQIPTRKSAVFFFLFHSGQMKALQVKKLFWSGWASSSHAHEVSPKREIKNKKNFQQKRSDGGGYQFPEMNFFFLKWSKFFFCQICIFDFHCVAKNIKGWIRIWYFSSGL